MSQLPILSKILERVIFTQLMQYLESNHLIHPNHHGGGKGRNTATALTQMYDYWAEMVEENKLVGAMLVDLSAAYDTVDFSILLEKLKIFRLNDLPLKWMKCFLNGRAQSVDIDGKHSCPVFLEQGLSSISSTPPTSLTTLTTILSLPWMPSLTARSVATLLPIWTTVITVLLVMIPRN